MSYPKSFDLPQASSASRNPQTPSNQKAAGSVRDPSRTVMNALENPFLPGSDWVYIPYEGKAGPETIGSQTSVPTVDTAAFNNNTDHAQNGLSKTNVETFNASSSGSVPNAHNASGFPTTYINVDETSNDGMTASNHNPENEYPRGPEGGSSTAFNVSHMATWAEKDINKMIQE